MIKIKHVDYKCTGCGNELTVTKVLYPSGIFEFRIEPCGLCTKDDGDCGTCEFMGDAYGKCSECEDLPTLKEEIKKLKEEMEKLKEETAELKGEIEELKEEIIATEENLIKTFLT